MHTQWSLKLILVPTDQMLVKWQFFKHNFEFKVNDVFPDTNGNYINTRQLSKVDWKGSNNTITRRNFKQTKLFYETVCQKIKLKL